MITITSPTLWIDRNNMSGRYRENEICIGCQWKYIYYLLWNIYIWKSYICVNSNTHICHLCSSTVDRFAWNNTKKHDQNFFIVIKREREREFNLLFLYSEIGLQTVIYFASHQTLIVLACAPSQVFLTLYNPIVHSHQVPLSM